MVDRSTRCISQVFGFLKDIENCDNCNISSGSSFSDAGASDSGSQLLKKSLSDTKLFTSPVQSQPQVVRKCVCHLTRGVGDDRKDSILTEDISTRENGVTEKINVDDSSIGVNGELCICEQETLVVETVESDDDAIQKSKMKTRESEDTCQVVNSKVDSENDGVNGSEMEEEDVLMRPKIGLNKQGDRSNTQVVSEMFRFLNTDSTAMDDNMQSELHIQHLSSLVEKEDEENDINNEVKKQECLDVDVSQEGLTSSVHSTENVNSDNSPPTINESSVPDPKDSSCHRQQEHIQGNGETGSEVLARSGKNKMAAVTDSGYVPEDEVVNEDGSHFNNRDTVTDLGLHEGLTKSAIEKCPDKVCGGQATTGGDEVVRRRRQLSRKSETDDHSDDSSDEDTGIYAESYRNSTWICVDEDGELGVGKSASLPTRKTTDPDVDVRASSASMSDDVFMEGRGSPMVRTHKRSDSSTTTLSETEFKRQYTTRRKCLIQRDDSQQEYHRLSAKFYDQERMVVVQKEEDEANQDFGLHIIDYQPAYITSVDPGSPAERAGLQEGQILISVNGVNVLEATHNEIVSLMQQNPSVIKLEVAYSDFQPVRDLQASVMAGYMYKLGNATLMKTWKKRFFVLRQDNCLYYYKTAQEQIPLGALPLGGYTISRFIDTNKDYCFKADKYGARSYFFMTDSRDEMTEWVGKLTEAATRSKKRKDSWLEVSSHNVGLPALEIRRPESTGYLNKMGRQRKVWKKRYCVLKDACIYYYKLMSSHSAQGVAHLHGYEVDKTGIPGKRHSFILKPPEPAMRTFYFCAENETDKARWVDAMTRSIQRWVKIDNK